MGLHGLTRDSLHDARAQQGNGDTNGFAAVQHTNGYECDDVIAEHTNCKLRYVWA